MTNKLFFLFCVFLATTTPIWAQFPYEEIIFAGKVIKISPGPFVVSGDIPSYGLVKYKITKIYVGKYDKEEIVVDHLILTGNELDNIKPGNKVKITVHKSKSIALRINFHGIRETSEAIEFYYLARGTITRVKRSQFRARLTR